MNCRKTNVLPTSCVCGGMRSSRPTGAVQKEFARPRERRSAAMLPRAFVQGQKTEVHAPGFLEFAKQIPLNTCAKRTKKGTPEGVPFASLRDAAHTLCALFPPNPASGREDERPKGKRPKGGAISCRIPAVPEQAGQACRSRPRKILRKSRGVYLTFTPLPAPERRGRPCCAGARGLSQKVSSELFEYLRGTASPLEACVIP